LESLYPKHSPIVTGVNPWAFLCLNTISVICVTTCSCYQG
jgi:hypothetical protein